MIISFREEVEGALTRALSSLEYPTDDLGIEQPPEDVEAVLASSVAYRLAGVAGAPPPAVAEEIAGAIAVDSLSYVAGATPQGPYVNFTPSEAYFEETLSAAARDGYGRLPDREESVVIEHTSANPTGPVHVGRARNPIVGDAVARVLDLAGYEVERHFYVNDAGRQMALFTWAYEAFDEEDLEEEPSREGDDYDLVRYYRKGNEFLEDGDPEDVERAEDEIQSIMQGLEEGDEATYERVSAVVEPMLSGMSDSLARLPAEFDEFVRETRFMRDGSTDDVVERLKDLDEAVYEEEAWQLDLTAHGIDKNLVFLRSDGTSLYPTRDLAHHEWKLENFDRAVTVLGEDHKLQARQVRTGLELLGNDTDPLDQVIYSYVNLPEGKMSTRAGTAVNLDDLLDEAVDRAEAEVRDRMDDRIRDDHLDEDDVDRIARQVGIGAVRYDIVAKQPTKAITFEWERALDFDAQSAPYVQYVHARACGILDRADGDPDPAAADAAVLEAPEERDLLKVIAEFPGVVATAAEDLEPHAIATYTRTFADRFNAFYRECPVTDESVPPERRAARLTLVAAARNAVSRALWTLGVEAPESM